MNDSRLDKMFKNELQNLDSEVNTNELWHELEPRLPRRKKKNRMFIFFILGFIMFIYLFKFQSDLPKKTKEQHENILVNKDNEGQNSTYPTKHLASINTNQNNFKTDPIISDAIDLITSNNSVIRQNTNPNKLSITSILSTNKEIKKTLNIAQTRLSQNTRVNEFDLKDLSIAKRQKLNPHEGISNLPFTNINTSRELKPRLVKLQQEIKSKKPIRLRAYFGFSHIFKKLQALDISDQRYLNQRKSTENPLYARSYGLDFSIPFKTDWFVSFGLNYEHIIDKFYFSELLTQDYTLNPESSLLTTQTFGTHNEFNDYLFYNLPVSLGRNFKYKKLTFSCEAGFKYNLKSTFDGKFLNPDQSVNIDNKLVKAKNHSWFLAIGLNYNLSHRIQFSSRVKLNSFFKSINETQIPITQNYSYTGIDVGLTFSLGK